MIGFGGFVEGWNAAEDRFAKRRSEALDAFSKFKELNPDATALDFQSFIDSQAGGSNYLRGIFPGESAIQTMVATQQKKRADEAADRAYTLFQRDTQISDYFQRLMEPELLANEDTATALQKVESRLPEDLRDDFGRWRSENMDMGALRNSIVAKRANELLDQARHATTQQEVEALLIGQPKDVADRVRSAAGARLAKIAADERRERTAKFLATIRTDPDGRLALQMLDQNAEYSMALIKQLARQSQLDLSDDDVDRMLPELRKTASLVEYGDRLKTAQTEAASGQKLHLEQADAQIKQNQSIVGSAADAALQKKNPVAAVAVKILAQSYVVPLDVLDEAIKYADSRGGSAPGKIAQDMVAKFGDRLTPHAALKTQLSVSEEAEKRVPSGRQAIRQMTETLRAVPAQLEKKLAMADAGQLKKNGKVVPKSEAMRDSIAVLRRQAEAIDERIKAKDSSFDGKFIYDWVDEDTGAGAADVARQYRALADALADQLPLVERTERIAAAGGLSPNDAGADTSTSWWDAWKKRHAQDPIGRAIWGVLGAPGSARGLGVPGATANPAPAPAVPPAPPAPGEPVPALRPGDVMDGYVYVGPDPADENSWRPLHGAEGR